MRSTYLSALARRVACRAVGLGALARELDEGLQSGPAAPRDNVGLLSAEVTFGRACALPRADSRAGVGVRDRDLRRRAKQWIACRCWLLACRHGCTLREDAHSQFRLGDVQRMQSHWCMRAGEQTQTLGMACACARTRIPTEQTPDFRDARG